MTYGRLLALDGDTIEQRLAPPTQLSEFGVGRGKIFRQRGKKLANRASNFLLSRAEGKCNQWKEPLQEREPTARRLSPEWMMMRSGQHTRGLGSDRYRFGVSDFFSPLRHFCATPNLSSQFEPGPHAEARGESRPAGPQEYRHTKPVLHPGQISFVNSKGVKVCLQKTESDGPPRSRSLRKQTPS